MRGAGWTRGGEVAAVGNRERGRSVGSDQESPASIYSFDSSPMLESVDFEKAVDSALYGGNLPVEVLPRRSFRLTLGEGAGALWGRNPFSGSREEAYACSLKSFDSAFHVRDTSQEQRKELDEFLKIRMFLRHGEHGDAGNEKAAEHGITDTGNLKV